MTNQLILFFSWYLLISLFGFIALPLVMQLFKNIPDRGYSITKIVGLLLVAYVHWLLTSIGLLQNSVAGIWSAIAVVTLVMIVFVGTNGIKASIAWMKENRTTVIFVEVLFLFCFGLMALVRAYTPDIWGTEKPMELMFINSILRSSSFPPHDAWLSGYGISYYYFGYLMVALLAKITQTSGGVAFNLGIAMTFALAAMAAFGLVLNLVALRKQKDEQTIRKGLERSILPALLAPVLLLLAGNLYGVLDVLHQNSWMSNLNVPSIIFDASQLDPAAISPQTSAIQAKKMNFWEWMDLKQLGAVQGTPRPITSLQQPNWFFASRAIQDRNLGGQSQELIDEFPAFSFLLADLHPHVLALPYVILCLILALQWFTAGKDELTTAGKAKWERVVLSAIILGSLIFLNTWDYPIYAFIFLIVAVVRNFPLPENIQWKDLWRTLWHDAVPVLILSVLFYLPFLLSLQTQAGGILPNLVTPSRFRQVFVMFAPLMLPVSAFLVAYLIKQRAKFDGRFAWKFGLGLLGALLVVVIVLVLIILTIPDVHGAVLDAVYPFSWREGLQLILQRRLVESTTLLFAFLIVSLAAGFIWGWRFKKRNSSLFVFILIFTGALLLLGPELVYLRDQFGNRMNTVFKFYFQIWVLWSIASGYLIWFIFTKSQRLLRSLWVSAVFILISLGLVYSIGTVSVITDNFSREPNLDGMAYFYRNYPQDGAVVDWLVNNAGDDAVVLEGTKGAYWVEGRSSRFAMATGISTVMGWVNHESQWRGKYFSNVGSREEDIRTIYTSRDWDTISDLLDRYAVDYVIISPEESQWYGAVYYPVFEQHMSKVFEAGDTVVFQR